MPSTARKMAAPVVISVLILLYYIFAARLLLPLAPPGLMRLVGSLMPMGAGAALGIVLRQLLREIRSGEQDDVSKY